MTNDENEVQGTLESTANMAAAGILEVMKVVEKASKTAESPELRYKYVAHAQLVADVRAALIDQGLIMLPVDGTYDLNVHQFKNSTGWHGVVGYTFDIIHVASGDKVTVGPIFGEGFDVGDKAIPKSNTNSHKYAMLLSFMLPSEDDPEADGETDKLAGGDAQKRDVPVFVLANAFGVCTDLDVEAEELAKILTSCGVAVETRKARSGKDVEWAKDIALPVVIAAQKNSDEREKRDIDELRKMADFLLGEKQVSDTRTDDGPPPPTDDTGVPF